MRRYEVIYVLRPDLAEEEIESLSARFGKLIADQGGKVLVEDRWGLRTLAYMVRKFRKGYYIFLDVAAKPSVVEELERNFKMVEQVIRFISVLKDKDVDLEALEKEIQKPAAPKSNEEHAGEGEGSGRRSSGRDGEDEDDEDSHSRRGSGGRNRAADTTREGD